MENKRPQLSPDELHQLKWLLGGVLVLLSAWTVFYLDLDGWTLMGLTTAAVLAALARPQWPARVPLWLHRLAFPIIVVFFVGDLLLLREALPAIVRLDLLLLLYRGISYRKKRDDLQIIVLGLFLIVMAGVLTVSLLFAAQILVFTACALLFLLVVTLVDLAEKDRPAAAAETMPRWAAVSRRHLWRRVCAVTDGRVVLLSVGLFVGVVGVSALLFLAIPRFQLENSLFLERFVSKKSRSGFSESITFGAVTEIQQDNSLAASVDVTDRTQLPPVPYWRMLVLDEYRNGSFRLSARQRKAAFPREWTAATVTGTMRPRRGEAVYWTFYLESGISRYLPLLGNFSVLRFREMQNFRPGLELGLVALRDEPVSMTAYRVEGMGTGDVLADPRFARHLSEAAAGSLSEETLQLGPGIGVADQSLLQANVQEITGGAALPVSEFVTRANAWLLRSHTYSLNPQIPAGRGDVLVRWLESKEPGHCELFAGSLVLLARTAGHPARVVTGFRGGTWNGYSNNLSLRNSDAHAWVEIFDRSAGGWRRADPTPGVGGAQTEEARAAAAAGRRTDRSWSARLESLRVFWYRRIVNFDQQSQVETLQAVKAATESSGKRLREWSTEALEKLKAWLSRPWDFGRLLGVTATIALVIGATWGGRWLRRRWWRGGARGARLDPVRAEASRWLTRLAELGIDDETLRSELRRLRFGPRGSWGQAERIFQQARRHRRRGRKEQGEGRRETE